MKNSNEIDMLKSEIESLRAEISALRTQQFLSLADRHNASCDEEIRQAPKPGFLGGFLDGSKI